MVFLGTVGVVLMMGAWELVGRLELLGRNWQPLSVVVRAFLDNLPIFGRATRATAIEAGKGFVAGILLGLVFAVLGLLAPLLNRGIGRMATLVNSIPWIALGPLLVVVVSQETVPFTFALLAVFFSSFIAISSGFYLAGQGHHDVFTSLGSSRWTRFRRLQLPIAVPSLIYAAKLGAPAAMFGVVFGEWFGSSRPGLGALIVTSMRSLRADRLWAAATITSLIAIAMFAAFAALEASAIVGNRSTDVSREAALPESPSSIGLSWARRLLVAIWPYVLVVAAWQAWVTFGKVHRLVIPGPGAVAFDIWSAPAEYWSFGWRTVIESAAGLAIGTAIGVAAAVAVWLSRVLRGLLTTSMILLYSAPIVATIPIMARVLGYSPTTVLAVAAMVSMFPTFVLVSSGLRAVPPGSLDVFRSLGAPRKAQLWKLAVPAAMPNFLVAFRLNAAVSFIAAVIGEYLTGVRGLGWMFGLSFSRFDVDRAWGAAIVIVALSILYYATAGRIEERGLERWT